MSFLRSAGTQGAYVVVSGPVTTGPGGSTWHGRWATLFRRVVTAGDTVIPATRCVTSLLYSVHVPTRCVVQLRGVGRVLLTRWRSVKSP